MGILIPIAVLPKMWLSKPIKIFDVEPIPSLIKPLDVYLYDIGRRGFFIFLKD